MKPDREVVGTIEGGASSGIDASAPGAEASRKTGTGLAANVKGDDSSATVNTEEASDWSLAAVVSWAWGGEEQGSVELAMAGQRERLTGTSLSDGELDTLLDGRAQNPVLWNACCGDPRGHQAWVTTGLRIRAPQLDPKLADVDPAGARRVAQLQALADFVAGTPDSVVASTLDAVLNKWGASVLGADLGAALGTRHDWPAGTEEVEAEWSAVIAQLDALDGCEAAAVGQGDASAFETLAWMVWDDLGLLSEAVSALDITDTGFVASKITEVAVLRTSVVERIRAVQLLTGAETCVGADGTVGADAVDVDTVELEGLMEAVDGFKRQEGVVFGAAQALSASIGATIEVENRLGRLYVAWWHATSKVQALLESGGHSTTEQCVEPDGERAFDALVGVMVGSEAHAQKNAVAILNRLLAKWRV